MPPPLTPEEFVAARLTLLCQVILGGLSWINPLPRSISGTYAPQKLRKQSAARNADLNGLSATRETSFTVASLGTVLISSISRTRLVACLNELPLR